MTLLAPKAIDFEDTWVLLESSLITILQDLGQGFPNGLWMSLYTGVYKLCTKPMDPQHSKLYGRLKVRRDASFGSSKTGTSTYFFHPFDTFIGR